MNLIKLQTKAHCYCDANIQAIAKSLVCDVPREFKHKFVDKIIALFENGTMTWFALSDPVPSQKAVTEFVINHPEIADKCKKSLFDGAKTFNIFLKKLQNVSHLTNKELWEIYDEYFTRYRELYLWGEPVAMWVKDNVADYLLQHIKSKEDLNTVVSPNYISFTRREQIDLLKIAIKIKKDKSIKDKLIKAHTKKWRWIPYDYGVTTWTEEHFRNELNNIKDPEKKLKEIKEYYSNLKKNQQKLIKRLSLDNNIIKLIDMQKTFAILMDYKKEVFTKAHLTFKPLIEEIGKRLGLSLNEAKSLLNNEIKEGLTQNKFPDKKIIKRRIQLSVMTVTEQGDYAYLSEQEAQAIYQQYIKTQKETTTTLTGYPASYGKVTGRVRVITNARHIHELKKGEILVTYMTSPDYTAGMKIAAAIITDEGGITSHAAIVSRELKIPCIIGTKVATSMLKDGDIIEVDATDGSITLQNQENINKGNKPFWQLCADIWKKLEPPLCMAPKEIEIYKRFIQKYAPKDKNALLLGATPQLRDMLHELGYKVTLIDINPDMIKGMDQLLKKSKNQEKKIIGNWLDIGTKLLKEERFDLITGDHFFNHISYENYPKLLQAIKKVLKNNGLFVCNVALRRARAVRANKVVDIYRKNPQTFNDIRTKILWLYIVLGNDPKIYDKKNKNTNWIGFNNELQRMKASKLINEAEFNDLFIKDQGEKDVIISFVTDTEFRKETKKRFTIIESDHVSEHEVYKHHLIYAMKHARTINHLERIPE